MRPQLKDASRSRLLSLVAEGMTKHTIPGMRTEQSAGRRCIRLDFTCGLSEIMHALPCPHLVRKESMV
jgi:hypothetical protein